MFFLDISGKLRLIPIKAKNRRLRGITDSWSANTTIHHSYSTVTNVIFYILILKSVILVIHVKHSGTYLIIKKYINFTSLA